MLQIGATTIFPFAFSRLLLAAALLVLRRFPAVPVFTLLFALYLLVLFNATSMEEEDAGAKEHTSMPTPDKNIEYFASTFQYMKRAAAGNQHKRRGVNGHA